MDLAALDRHRVILGWCYIVIGAVGVLAALVALVAIAGGGLLSRDRQAIAVTGIVGAALAGFLLVIALPAVLGGVGLLKRKYWGKVLALIVGLLNLPNVPIGTLLGAYTLWFWFQPNADALFERRGTPPRFGPPTQPPELPGEGPRGWPRRQTT